jgi:hypothetical protein
MSRPPQNLALHLCPINRLVELLVQPPDHRDAVPAHNVQPQRDFFARHAFIARPDDALRGFLEHQVHGAVAGEERADHGAAVEGEDGHALWGGLEGVYEGEGRVDRVEVEEWMVEHGFGYGGESVAGGILTYCSSRCSATWWMACAWTYRAVGRAQELIETFSSLCEIDDLV